MSDTGGDELTESERELIRQLDDARVVEMLETEGSLTDSDADRTRVQKQLLDDLGLFDIDPAEYDLSDALRNRIEHLRYVNVEGTAQREPSAAVRREVAERLRELGYEPSPSDDDGQ
ncbi:hypothetical protein [Haloglomus litoreum]|uniref:hypothetical protein n=1 Tax=Haloglomus litoreum TaxID=3034026 RepID=UPI0023E835E5|nr:hypothetical protein [Haloglomus sp. DT116]